ncbi:phosphoribosylanthranilate isomerase [Anaerosporobacter faecicola]|uniref:phosphoribosylanthranilate isomerase n=1 Tax=Anaerosporobacter faecicola TaxID=2718714 RepID=UPI00143B3E64|nr:phosphoribosylanthranilate isomerase [Anaerosporobacter faecicola]
MSTTKIKICGLRRQEDVEYVNNYKPDYIGFVFAKSKRQVTAQQAEQLRKALDPTILSVGVFVNQPVEQVANLLNRDVIQYAQLHGEEDQTYIDCLRKLLKTEQKGIIKAVRVKDAEDIKRAQDYDCEYLLLDTYSVDCEGGNGKTFDWNLIHQMKKPFFLAGGITVSNVEEAIARVQPYGIDASSGLETNGYKEEEKIKQFVEIIRTC